MVGGVESLRDNYSPAAQTRPVAKREATWSGGSGPGIGLRMRSARDFA